MIAITRIVNVQVKSIPAQPKISSYLLTEPLRERLESLGVTPSDADERAGRVPLMPPLHLEGLYQDLAYGDVQCV